MSTRDSLNMYEAVRRFIRTDPQKTIRGIQVQSASASRISGLKLVFNNRATLALLRLVSYGKNDHHDWNSLAFESFE